MFRVVFGPERPGRAPAMAICADDLALRDLGLDAIEPHKVADHARDVRHLDATNVIKLEHHRIFFSAVDAASITDQLDDPLHDLSAPRRLTRVDLRAPVLGVRVVPLLAVVARAWRALRLPQPHRLIFPRERRLELLLFASRTAASAHAGIVTRRRITMRSGTSPSRTGWCDPRTG
jgi:hypothetical protein